MANTKLDARQSVLRAALGMVGSSANDSLDTIFPRIDAELAKLFEDRNILLVSDGIVAFPVAGTTVTFTSNLRLHVNSQIAGGAPTVIDLGSTTRTLSASGRMIYAVINRTSGTATVTDDATTLPAQTSVNQEVFLIAKRVDATDGTKRVYFRNGFSISAGTSGRFGQGAVEFVQTSVVTDSTTTGTAQTLATFASGVVRLTNTSLASLAGIPAGASGQQLILENKTINTILLNNEDATATAANRILTGTGTAVAMPADSSFMFVYDTTSSRWQLASGSGSSTGSATINYILNPSAESSTQGFATYADAAGTVPVDGTGGSPVVTFTRSTSAPLRGVASYLFTKDAANRQGNGVSYDFTIDSADQAKELTVDMDYSVASGTYLTGDVAVYLFDITNSQVIQPAGYIIESAVANFPLRRVATFQTAYNSTSYRLIFHVASTSTSAYVLKMDRISVGPTAIVQGTPVTDWTKFTMVIGGSTSAPAKGATILIDQGYWRRVGDHMEIRYEYSQTAAGSAGSGTYLFTIPTSATIDGSKVTIATPSTNVLATTLGPATAYDGTISYYGDVRAYNSTSLSVYVGSVAAEIGSGSQPCSLANTVIRIAFTVTVPILGWASNVIMSSQTNSRDIAASYAMSANTSVTSGTQINFDTKLIDTHGAVTVGAGVWKFIAPVSGNYPISVTTSCSASSPDIEIYKNGSPYAYILTAVSGGNNYTGSTIVPMVAGDFIDARPASTATLVGSTVPYRTTINIQKPSGSATIAKDATVAVSYHMSANQSIATGTVTIINFDTQDIDTTGAVTVGSSWKFIAPQPGIYIINSNLQWQSAPGSTSYRDINIYKNGSILISNESGVISGNNFDFNHSINYPIKLIAGDFIDIRGRQGSGGALNVLAQENGAIGSFISITKMP